MTPRAITGFGVLSPHGVGREAFTAALRDGAPPACTLTAFDVTAYPGARAAEVPDFDATRFLGDKGLRSLDRQTKLLVVAARLALRESGLKKDGAFVALTPERVGLCASNAYGSLEAVVELDRVAVLEDPRYINPAKFPNTVANSASGYVSIWEDLRALNVAVSDGSCGALDTVLCADVYLATGRADAILVGGGEALSEALYVAFQRLGSLVAGTLLGEGAALFVLETMESARARGARVDAVVLGAASTFDGPARAGALLHPSAAAMERAVTEALRDGGVKPGDVDLVVSGIGEAGVFADAELLGIERALGEPVPVVASRRLLTETLGASGALAMAAAVVWMEGVPVRGLVRGAAPPEVKTVVVTSLGFHGNASAVVLRRA
jgi:3-oxoacyl-(acyl-carrier-protein) synthase